MRPAWKDTIRVLHEKYYGSQSKKQKEISMEKLNDGPSRKDLMEQAKQMGIKNFRILNKAELTEVINENTSGERREEIVSKAVAKWKQGWGSREAKVAAV